MSCDAAIRPFPNDTELRCNRDGEHQEHSAVLRDYAFHGSRTELSWQDTDRRCFHGEWPGPCPHDCVLPAGHRGGCAS